MLPKKGIVFPNVEKLKSTPPLRARICVSVRSALPSSAIRREPLLFQGAKQPANLFDTRLEDRRIRAAGPHGFAGRWFQFAARRHQSCRAVCPASSA